jgi:hypothetical protein
MTQALRMLLAENLITFDQLDQATALSAARGGTVDFHLVQLGAIEEEQLVRFLVRRFPVQHWTRNRLQTVSDRAIAAVPAHLALQLHAIPVVVTDDRLVLALTDPSRRHAIEEIAHHTGLDITPAVVTHSDLTWALGAFYHGQTIVEPRSEPSRPPPGLPLDEAVRAIPLMHVKSRPDGRYGAALAIDRDTGRARVEVLHLPPAVPAPAVVAISPIMVAAPAPSPRATAPLGPIAAATPVPSAAMASGPDSWSTPPPPKAPPASTPAPAPSAAPPPAAPSRPPPPPRSEGVLLAAMAEAATRDEIIVLALEYLRRFADRAVFLAVKKQEIRGMDIAGKGTSREAIRSFWVPISARSTLSQVIAGRQLHLGSLSRHPADGVLSAALGGRPDRVLVIPVIIRNRVVALLYADSLAADLPPGQRLVRLAETVADGFARQLSAGGA